MFVCVFHILWYDANHEAPSPHRVSGQALVSERQQILRSRGQLAMVRLGTQEPTLPRFHKENGRNVMWDLNDLMYLDLSVWCIQTMWSHDFLVLYVRHILLILRGERERERDLWVLRQCGVSSAYNNLRYHLFRECFASWLRPRVTSGHGTMT